MKLKWILLLLILVSLSCTLSETAVTPTNIDSPPSPAPVSTPESRYDGPQPEKGTGNVYGEVLWNGASATGLDVSLCQELSFFSGCEGQEYTAVTDEAGAYLFANIQPGEYALSLRVFDSDHWIYITDGILSAANFAVTADETLVIASQNIFKLDMRPLEPGYGAEVKSSPITLSWEAYPDAAYYEIYFTPDKGESIFVSERVAANHISADLLPINCDYRWGLEAFNSDNVKIVETDAYATFRVVDEAASCHLAINAPASDVSIAASGVVLEWEPHPLAASYKILLWDDSEPASGRNNILDFTAVTESQYVFDSPLTPDHRYVWSVYAYDASGNKIAASEIVNFTAHTD